MNIPEWFHWPKDEFKGRVAWYTVARRGIFVPFLFIGVVICCVSLAAMYGYKEAERFFMDFI